MKKRIKNKMYLVESQNKNLAVIVKIDYGTIIQGIKNAIGNKEFNNVDLSILVNMPKDFTVDKVKNNSGKILKKYLSNVDEKQVEKQVEMHTALVILRSNINKVVYEEGRKKIGCRIGGFQGGKEEGKQKEGKGYDDCLESDFEQTVLSRKKINVYDKKVINKEMNHWKSQDFAIFAQKLFVKRYGIENLEWNLNTNGLLSSGKIVIMLSDLIKKIKSYSFDNSDVSRYIEWVYTVKGNQISFPILTAFLSSNVLITEWLVKEKGNKKISLREQLKGE